MKKTILINIMLSIILESHAKGNSPIVAMKVTKALDLLKIPEFSSGNGNEMSLLCALRDMSQRLLNRPPGSKIDIDTFFMDLEHASIYYPEVVTFIKQKLDGIDSLSDKELAKRSGWYIQQVNEYIETTEVSRMASQLGFAIRECQSKGDHKRIGQLLKEFKQESAQYEKLDGEGDYNPLAHIGGVREVSGTTNSKTLVSALDDAEITYEGEGLIKFGLQGWNDAFGPKRSVPRGVMIEIQALSGKSKSETMRRLLSDVCTENDPYLFNPGLKPVVLYFTAEDTTSECWNKLYIQFYCELTGTFPTEEVSNEEKAQYCMDHLTKRGIHFEIISCRKNETTPEEVLEVVQYYQTTGWEVLALGVDYMALYKHDHYDPSLLDTYKIQRKHSVIGGFCKENKILAFVANQLGSADAEEAAASEEDFARVAAKRGYVVGSRRIKDELDGRIVVHIKEAANGKWYHQFAVDKIRWAKGWPQANRYCCYEMHSIDGLAAGFILSDIGMESKACHDMGGGLKSGKGAGSVYF